jgi:hypothetical protein
MGGTKTYTMKKFLVILISVVVVGLALFLYYHYFFVFGKGVKAGELNYVVKKGYIFKTYEGKLIQSGIRSKAPGTIQSYEFEFSISDEAVAQKLMVNGGKMVQLHYNEYIAPVAWRGYSAFVVDSIISISEMPK